MAGLQEALSSADMLLINDLHAFEFTLDKSGLIIECMDGRELKRWHFVPESIAAARFEAEAGHWLIDGPDGVHRLTCLDAFTATDEDPD